MTKRCTMLEQNISASSPIGNGKLMRGTRDINDTQPHSWLITYCYRVRCGPRYIRNQISAVKIQSAFECIRTKYQGITSFKAHNLGRRFLAWPTIASQFQNQLLSMQPLTSTTVPMCRISAFVLTPSAPKALLKTRSLAYFPSEGT